MRQATSTVVAHRKWMSALALILPAALLATAPAPTWASVSKCDGMITGVHTNVVVPPAAHCTLQNAEVRGHVLVLKDATLQANASRIHGNVQGGNVRQVLLQYETQVGGDVRIRGADPGTTNGFDINVHVRGDARLMRNRGRIFVDAARVDGDLVIEGNISPGRLEVEWNTIRGDLNIEDNTAISAMSVLENRVGGDMEVRRTVGQGTKEVVNNTVRHNLWCFGNVQRFVGGPNAAELTHGQCF